MAKMLLTHGAQPNLADTAGNTPLHVATIFGHMELVKLLLQHGADVYKKGQYGALPVHMAAREGHASLVRLFCQFSEASIVALMLETLFESSAFETMQLCRVEWIVV
jgi:ankyrin repeat protein